MRPALIAALLLLLQAAGARAAGECRWQDPGRPPRVLVHDRIVVVHQYYSPAWARCLGQTKNKVVVRFLGPDDRTLYEDSAEIRAGKRDDVVQIDKRLFPNHVCEGKHPGKPRVVPTGPPGREHLATMVPVRVRIEATGELAPLAWTSPVVEVPCPACADAGGGDANILRGDDRRSLVLRITADPAWYECARGDRDGTLRLMAFGGGDAREAAAAIKPFLVLDHLEKKLTRRGDKLVLEEKLPHERLCPGGFRSITLEVWGRGDLRNIGSAGGRFVFDDLCR